MSNSSNYVPKPHVHAELIKKWADGAVIEYQTADGNWAPLGVPAWRTDFRYRVKPEPVSSMTPGEAYTLFVKAANSQREYNSLLGCKAVADEAVRRYVKESSKSS